MSEKIDFVVYWVDGSDEKWIRKKGVYAPEKNTDISKNRYRDMGTLKYLFRSIEVFAPWAGDVYFVVDHQIPDWMNVGCERLKIVNHDDYIPAEYLPTFSANPIELNFHRISELSERFVVCNDDFFLTSLTTEEDFFIDGLPVDIFSEFPLQYKSNQNFNRILFNDFSCIGKEYSDRKAYKKRLRNKILSPKYGVYFLYNLLTYCLPYAGFWGITTPHFMRPYLKSSFDDIWESHYELLDLVCHNRFRSENDVNIFLIRMRNLMQGRFVPGNIFKMGHAFMMHERDERIFDAIRNQKYKMICVNDECEDDDEFEKCKNQLIEAFETILPNKSQFERG